MAMSRPLRRLHERTALKAIELMESLPYVDTDDGVYGVQVYGFGVKPGHEPPSGWTPDTALAACRRLESRRELVGIKGDTFNPRRWRRPAAR